MRPFKKTRFDVSEPNGLTNFGKQARNQAGGADNSPVPLEHFRNGRRPKREKNPSLPSGDFKTQDAGI